MSYQLIFLVIISFSFSILFQFNDVARIQITQPPVRPPPPVSTTETPLKPSPPPVLLKPPPPPKQPFQSSSLPSTVINLGENGDKYLDEKIKYLNTDDIYENLEDSSRCERRTTKNWRVAKIEGDILLGGLMNIHALEDDTNCSPFIHLNSMQVLECMLFTIDWVNKKNLLRGITLGAYILDSCEDIDGLEQATYFIKGSLGNTYSNKLRYVDKLQTFPRKRIVGLVEAASSYKSMQAGSLLKLYQISQVRFSSTSLETRRRIGSKYFFSTFPSEFHEANAILCIILELEWKSLSILYDEPKTQVFKSYLKIMLAIFDICIADTYELTAGSHEDEDTFNDNIVNLLKKKDSVRGVVILASDKKTARVMHAVRRNNCTRLFSWIISGERIAKSIYLDSNQEELEGAILIQSPSRPISGFDKYFQKLNSYNNTRNPWFAEFWEIFFNCKLPETNTTHNINFTSICSGNETISQEKQYEAEEPLQFVSDSVLAFAYALKDMHDNLCGETKGLCDEMNPICGQRLFNYLQNVTFESLSKDEFSFSLFRNGPSRYNVLNFQRLPYGKYGWIKVGEYEDNLVNLKRSNIRFRMNEEKIPESTCGRMCGTGQIKNYVKGNCCWECFNCSKYQVLLNENTCQDCPAGQLSNTDHTSCENSYWVILSIVFASVGIILTMTVVIVYIKYNDTPVVKASSRELSYVLLVGIFLCYTMTFLFIQIPSDIMCRLQNIGIGLCFTIVYSAIFTKTNRIDRIFRYSARSTDGPSFINSKSQLIICSAIISIQVILSATWLVFSPEVVFRHPTRQENYLVCSYTHTVMFAYPMILIVMCTIYAILTRKIPEAFNESKFIGFTMYTTCIVWLAFIPTYITTTYNIEINLFTLSVTVSLSATVTLFCIFIPKIYIILVHPEKNIRQSLKQHQRGNKNGHRVIPKNINPVGLPESSNDANLDSQPEMSQTTSKMTI